MKRTPIVASAVVILTLTVAIPLSTRWNANRVPASPQAALVPGCNPANSADPESDFHDLGPLVHADASARAKALIQNLARSTEFDDRLRADSDYLTTLHGDPILQGAYAQKPCLQAVTRRGPSLNFLLASPAGVGEGYTIGEHTSLALTVLYEQGPLFYPQLNAAPLPSETPSFWGTFLEEFVTFHGMWRNFTESLVAFHDIGKSISFRAVGNNHSEEHFSVPLIKRYMTYVGFNERQANLAGELVLKHKLLGAYIMGQKDIDQTTREVREAAARSGINAKAFFVNLELLYVSDAAAYPYLRGRVFSANARGRLLPTSPEYQALRNLYQRLDH